MTTFEQLVAAVNNAVAEVGEARTLAAQGIQHVARSSTRMENIACGSSSYRLRDVLAALTAAITAIEHSNTAAASASAQLNTYLAAIGNSTTTVEAQPEAAPPPAAAESLDSTPRLPDGGIDFHALAKRLGLLEARPTEQPPFDPRRFNPACWQGLKPYDQAGTAEGNLFIAPGKRWNTRPMQASKLEVGPQSDLHPQWRSRKAPWHIEGKIAAYMRQKGFTDGCVYLNARPCSGPDGCARNLPDLLPVGSTLHVHARYIDRTGETRFYYREYRGTGKALT
ncbi:DddA-like double-stranded DNA deaminase toxin [Stackebrandtia nassauensis]|uniref:Nucleic acid/nucleotide deaminase of polymorphic system toxin n=1 Tax=Stackebrandtia nassauensis (strain DSM 44728 / CIP 108903 / NRRL B-16338 / NBRC 102104 / LLR-40K-21) TaxID=446470 RepID=D3PVT1_STANL|nr:DddA-like double-stranded DNA deaminase toxin [Stackebrandtia nassauensis]ADD45052.1 hypothetical protein Snas_5420 [Stackebrandtia nassauensis DSM 44728]